MTRDEILAMKPGRDMDVLVARRVMGWTDIEPIGPMYVGRPPGMKPVHPVDARFVPCYSTDDAAALEIIPAMAKRGYDCGAYYEADARRWTVYFLPPRCGSAKAQSGSLAEAICKAALLALLEEGEGA